MILALLGLHQGFHPKTIDLNDGWSYARVASPPSIWNGLDAMPTSQWKVLRVSSEETSAENAAARNAFDGNPKTIWHSQWHSQPAGYPHELVIDLGSVAHVNGFRLLPRVTGPQNGRPNQIQVFLSKKDGEWGSPVVADAVPNSSNLYQKSFSEVEARYLRLVVTDGYRDSEPFLAIAELGLIRSMTAQQKKDWASQYHIASVETGDDRFDLKGPALEEVKNAELKSIPAKDWQSATLPHAAWIRPLDKPEIWQGVTYYRRKISLPWADLGRHISFDCGGAMQVSDLWLNGEHIATRRGGYLPLVADLSGKAKTLNEILVRVDNRDNPLVPPGKPQQDLDFMYGAGLHREAHLTLENQVHFSRPGGMVRTLSIQGGVSELEAVIPVKNDSDKLQSCRILLHVHDYLASPRLLRYDIPPRSTQVQRLRFSVSNLQPWSPAHANLYQIDLKLENQERSLDSTTIRFGIRTISVSRDKGFVLNGKPLELVGTNRHQDYPWVGPALSENANRRDAKLIKDSGHNIVRLSHYPQSPEFLDACDEYGLLVIPCIAGWQFLNSDSRFEQRVLDDIKELVERDGSHPCVAWFETSLNETYPNNALAKKWYDAGKSTIFGSSVLLAGDAKPGAPWDIAYNQWRDEDMSRPQTAMPDKPGYVREYGDYEFGGGQSTSRVRVRDGMEKLLGETWNHVWSLNHLKPQLPWTMGFGTWEMFDHNVPWEFSVSASGLADIMRREKPSYWFYKSQTVTTPYVKLAADWQPGAANRMVAVFTNAKSATLFLNGRKLETRLAEKGATTAYNMTKPFDASNTDHLVHPPIVFRNVRFSPGELKVVAGGISDSVRTAAAPDHLKVWIDDLGVKPGRNDLVFARVAVVDAKGVVCSHDSHSVHLYVSGATVAGESSVAAEAGIASFLVRTPLGASSVSLQASSVGLRTGSTAFQIR